MSTAVFVGGLSASPERVDYVSAALSDLGYESVYGYTIDSASDKEKTEELYWNTAGSDVYTHAEGLVWTYGTRPKRLVAIAPPSPMKISKLVVLGLANSIRTYQDGEIYGEADQVKEVVRDGLELYKVWKADSRRRIGLLGAIASSNALSYAVDFRERAGTSIHLVYGETDVVNRYEGKIAERGEGSKIKPIIIKDLIRDSILINPRATLEQIRTEINLRSIQEALAESTRR